MNRMLSALLFLVISATITTAQNPYHLPVDTITSGPFDDRHPALSSSSFLMWGFQAQWLVFERHTEDSSFIIGKKMVSSPFINTWDSAETVIASSPASAPLEYPDLAFSAMNPAMGWCAVWQRTDQGVSSIHYSFYSDSAGHWTAPVVLAEDSVSNENPLVVSLGPGYSAGKLFVVWSRRNAIFRADFSTGPNPVIDTVVVTNMEDPQFDITTSDYDKYIVAYTQVEDSSRLRICNAVFSRSGFELMSLDTVKANIEPGTSPCFVQPLYYPLLLWVGKESEEEEIFGVSSYSPLYEKIPMTGVGRKRDLRAFTSPVVTASAVASNFLYINVLAYTRDNGIDTVVMIHAPGLHSLDTVRSSGYNSSPSIGSSLIVNGSQTYVPVVWESNRNGRSHIYGKLVYNPIGAVEDERFHPVRFSLLQNYPNPFNPSTTIEFTLASSGWTTLTVYDLIGREIATLAEGYLNAGVYHRRVFDGSRLTSGLYFVRLQSGGMIKTMKMLLLK